MPMTGPDRAERAEVMRAHAEMMRGKWAAATADIERAKANMRNKIGEVTPPQADPFAPATAVLRHKLAEVCSTFSSNCTQMLEYAKNVEGKLKGAAGAGASSPTNLHASFNKLKDWLASANKADLPSFPRCFALLQQLRKEYNTHYKVLIVAPHMVEQQVDQPRPSGPLQRPQGVDR